MWHTVPLLLYAYFVYLYYEKSKKTRMVMIMGFFSGIFKSRDAPSLKQIRSCAHIHTGAKLPSGEAVVLACFSFRKFL